MALKPKIFLIFHAYISFAYFVTFVARSNASHAQGLVFTLLVMSPLFFAISKGLPIDCLGYEMAIKKETQLENK